MEGAHMWSWFTSKSVCAESAQTHISGPGKGATGEEQLEKERDLKFKRENGKGWRDFSAFKNQLYKKWDVISKLESRPDLV